MPFVKKCLQTDGFWIGLSAFLSAVPLSVPSLFFLSWIGFAPLFYVLLREGGKGTWGKVFLRGFSFGFLYYAMVYYWFLWLYPLDFAGLDNAASVAVVCLGWLGISLVHGIFFVIPSLLTHFALRHSVSPLFSLLVGIFGILVALWMTELSQLAFPWVRLSLGQYRAPILIQSASLFGIQGLDLLLLLVSGFFALAILEKGRGRTIFCLLSVTVFSANLLYGAIALSQEHEKAETAEVSLVQGGILSGEKWEDSSHSLNTYLEMTRSVSEECDLVVWPESAVPINLSTHPDLLSLYQDLAKDQHIAILMGCFWKQEGETTNSAILVEEDRISEPYSKQILVPFGERVPYRSVLTSFFPFLGEINLLSSDLAAGSDSALMQWQGKSIGSVICFESLFPKLVGQSVRDGAELIVIVTNDSWYKDSPGVWQHLAHGVFRSVENGRSTVRCAASGVSAVINEKGEIQTELGPLQQGILEESVSFSSHQTLYSHWGNWTFPLLGGCLLLWGIVLVIQQKRREKCDGSGNPCDH